MKKIIRTLLILLLVLCTQTVSAESIDRYHVDMLLNKDSSVDITETIYYDFGENNKHGIFRFIPVNFNVKGQQKWGGLKERKLEFSNLSVTRDQIPENFITEDKDSSGNYFIKIGDPNKTIKGIHHYEIKYTVDGSLRYFDDVDEVYWNAIGLDWKVPIKTATVGLRKSDPDIQFAEMSCYRGSLESNSPCEKIERLDDVILFSNHSFVENEYSLNAGEGITVAVALKEKGMVDKNEIYSFTILSFILGIGAVIISCIVGAIYSIRKYLNKYKIYDPIYPRYEPPQGFSPVGVGYLVDKRFDGRDITAGIISLAQRGYISIEQIDKGFLQGKDYVFSLLKDIKLKSENDEKTEEVNIDDTNLSVIDRNLLKLIFNTSQKDIKLSDVSKTNAIELKELIRKSLKSSYTQEGYVENLFKKFDISERKTLSSFINIFGIKRIILFIIFLAISSSFIGAFVLVPIVIFSIFGSSFRRYTKKGWKAKFAIEGFKDFLSMTEKHRYELLNNPADSPKEFFEYLPYAIAMGVEKKWAKQFELLTLENPIWYSGVNTFNSVNFVSHLSSFNDSMTSASKVKSSGSGSSGGGFSGGGSGGGGGGSW